MSRFIMVVDLPDDVLDEDDDPPRAWTASEVEEAVNPFADTYVSPSVTGPLSPEAIVAIDAVLAWEARYR